MSFTCSRSSWLSCFSTCIHSWSTFSTSSRICRSFCMSCFTSRWLFSCTSRRCFSMSFRTCIYCWSACFSITCSRVSWSYGGIFTFSCTSGRSFCMSFFTSSWSCRLFSMSFVRFIRLSFIMFRLLCFTVFICINDIFT